MKTCAVFELSISFPHVLNLTKKPMAKKKIFVRRFDLSFVNHL